MEFKFYPLFTTLNFCIQGHIQRVCSKERVSIVLGTEEQRRMQFWQLCRGKQTDISVWRPICVLMGSKVA